MRLGLGPLVLTGLPALRLAAAIDLASEASIPSGFEASMDLRLASLLRVDTAVSQSGTQSCNSFCNYEAGRLFGRDYSSRISRNNKIRENSSGVAQLRSYH